MVLLSIALPAEWRLLGNMVTVSSLDYRGDTGRFRRLASSDTVGRYFSSEDNCYQVKQCNQVMVAMVTIHFHVEEKL